MTISKIVVAGLLAASGTAYGADFGNLAVSAAGLMAKDGPAGFIAPETAKVSGVPMALTQDVMMLGMSAENLKSIVFSLRGQAQQHPAPAAYLSGLEDVSSDLSESAVELRLALNSGDGTTLRSEARRAQRLVERLRSLAASVENSPDAYYWRSDDITWLANNLTVHLSGIISNATLLGDKSGGRANALSPVKCVSTDGKLLLSGQMNSEVARLEIKAPIYAPYGIEGETVSLRVQSPGGDELKYSSGDSAYFWFDFAAPAGAVKGGGTFKSVLRVIYANEEEVAYPITCVLPIKADLSAGAVAGGAVRAR